VGLTSAIGTAFSCGPGMNSQWIRKATPRLIAAITSSVGRQPMRSIKSWAKRNAEGAGEAAEEGHQQDRLPVSRPVDPGDHGEGRLVEDDGLAGAEPDPQRVKTSAANRPSTIQ